MALGRMWLLADPGPGPGQPGTPHSVPCPRSAGSAGRCPRGLPRAPALVGGVRAVGARLSLAEGPCAPQDPGWPGRGAAGLASTFAGDPACLPSGVTLQTGLEKASSACLLKAFLFIPVVSKHRPVTRQEHPWR